MESLSFLPAFFQTPYSNGILPFLGAPSACSSQKPHVPGRGHLPPGLKFLPLIPGILENFFGGIWVGKSVFVAGHIEFNAFSLLDDFY